MKRESFVPDFCFGGLVMSLLLLIFNSLASATQTAQAPPLPTRDQYTITDLRDLVVGCQIDLDSERKYQQKLVQRIRELEKEVDVLKKSAIGLSSSEKK